MALEYGPKLGLLVHAERGEEYYEALTSFLRAIDTLVQCTAINFGSSPPLSRSDGDTYVIDAAPSGDWSSFSVGDIVRYSAVVTNSTDGWEAHKPKIGWITWVNAENDHFKYTSGGWIPLKDDPPAPEPGGHYFAQVYRGLILSGENSVVYSDIGFADEGAALGYAGDEVANKVYLEFELNYIESGATLADLAFGIVDAAAGALFSVGEARLNGNWLDDIGQPSSVYMYGNGVNYVNGQENNEAEEEIVAGSRLGIAMDISRRRMWLLHNGVNLLGGDPVAGTFGFVISDIPNPRPFIGITSQGVSVRMIPFESMQSFTPVGFSGWAAEG